MPTPTSWFPRRKVLVPRPKPGTCCASRSASRPSLIPGQNSDLCPSPLSILVRRPWRDRRTCALRQRSRLPIPRLAGSLSRARHQAQKDPPLPTADQRENRTVPPHPRRRLGLLPPLQRRISPPSSTPGMAALLQSPQTPHRHRQSSAHQPDLKQPDWAPHLGVLDEIEMPLVPVPAKMEITGITVNRGILARLTTCLDEKAADVAQRAYAEMGREINLSVPSSCRRFSSISSACRRPAQTRLASRPMPRASPICKNNHRIPSSTCSCSTAMSPSSCRSSRASTRRWTLEAECTHHP